MIVLSMIIWILNCAYVWYFNLYDFAYYLITAFVFFVPCVDLLEIVGRALGKGGMRKMWAINGLGLIFGLWISSGIALTSFRITENAYFFDMIYLPWALGFFIAFYFVVNFFLFSRKLVLWSRKGWPA
jgi:hypothetical protein